VQAKGFVQVLRLKGAARRAESHLKFGEGSGNSDYVSFREIRVQFFEMQRDLGVALIVNVGAVAIW
jgi:hypothetical protein